MGPIIACPCLYEKRYAAIEKPSGTHTLTGYHSASSTGCPAFGAMASAFRELGCLFVSLRPGLVLRPRPKAAGASRDKLHEGLPHLLLLFFRHNLQLHGLSAVQFLLWSVRKNLPCLWHLYPLLLHRSTLTRAGGVSRYSQGWFFLVCLEARACQVDRQLGVVPNHKKIRKSQLMFWLEILVAFISRFPILKFWSPKVLLVEFIPLARSCHKRSDC